MAAKTAGYGARALSRHVVPDSLLPSWKTRKTVQTGLSLLKRKKKKTSKPTSSGKATRKPGPPKPKQKFDRNAWLGGRSLVSSDHVNASPRSLSGSSSLSSIKSRAERLKAQARDLVRNPRLVASMVRDEIEHDLKQEKRIYSSKLQQANEGLRSLGRLFKRR